MRKEHAQGVTYTQRDINMEAIHIKEQPNNTHERATKQRNIHTEGTPHGGTQHLGDTIQRGTLHGGDNTRRGQHTEGTLYKGDIHAEGIYTWRRLTYGGNE